eukprot:TRINITY_DN11344_c0_g1_i1.p3 TRINITY_DN11344_c0_g1~~TRINITY_DN11344_c0_g1_i1.p3  ORF type:complete len:120 (+),score=11.80 TRINITY_DN11344_c0_g1_i1:223-582(+)
MGACCSAPNGGPTSTDRQANKTDLYKPEWSSPDGMLTRSELERQREEFWETQPSYGGAPEVWATLRSVVEADDLSTAAVYLDAAEIKIAKRDMTAFYDARGFLYEIPKYCVSYPSNMTS